MNENSAAGGDSRKRANRRFLPRWVQSNAAAAAALTGAGAVAFITTWILLSPAVEQVDRTSLIAMIVANVMIAAGFALLIGARFWHVWSDRRNQLAGSRMHMQLSALFSAVAVAPSILAFLFAFTILRTSLNDVFSERIDNYQETARELANSFVSDEAAELRDQMTDTAIDIRRNEELGVGLAAVPISFRRYLEDVQAQARGFAALYLLDGEKRIIAKVETQPGVYRLPDATVFREVDQGEPGERFSFGANDEVALDMYRGVMKISDYGGGYLVAYKPINPALSQRLLAVKAMREDWNEALRGRARLERVFVAGYVVLGIIILFGAVWAGLWAATRIVQPIGRLVMMAERVSSGDLGARVEVYRSDGELGELARAMNHMTAQLQTQRNDLIETNKQFDKRRRFTEAVLSGVSAGVVSLTADYRIAIANRSAADLLGVDPGRLQGASIVDLAPEIHGLLKRAEADPRHEIGDQIDIVRNGRIRTLNVRVVSDAMDSERSAVVTFDDITQLIAAQRNAAWGDVARRIAHEIKNPLTPIQLSAERLRRKYLKEVVSNPEVFDRCTDTIIRQVSDIGRMVDEFSSFARMPKPVIAKEDLCALVKSALFPQRVAFPDIEFETETPDAPVMAECDGRLMVQAISNLLKNAGESIGARLAREDSDGDAGATPGRIRVRLMEGGPVSRIEIIDNGVGLPRHERHRLAEPYMTTRAKGTGLGLAIVKKVVEEHGGSLEFDDDASLGPTGAKMTINLPAIAAGAGEAAASAAAAE
ncbi:MAG: ATP-binding protein [Parvularculaceae bacterium]